MSARTGAPARTGLWAIPVFVVILVAGWLAGGFAGTVPDLDGRATTGGIRVDPSYFALLFALVVYTASHIAEIVRGSIQAVPRGQGEAADALALSGFQRLWYVVLPQAFRIAIPPVGNQYLNLIKNSSLGAAIGYYDLTLVTQTAVGNGAPAVPAFAHHDDDLHRHLARHVVARERGQPPAGAEGAMIAWARRHLFRTRSDAALTLVFGALALYVAYRALRFLFVTGRWDIVEVNLRLLMVGRFPTQHLPRISVTLIVLAAWAGVLAGLVRSRQVRAGRPVPDRPQGPGASTCSSACGSRARCACCCWR